MLSNFSVSVRIVAEERISSYFGQIGRIPFLKAAQFLGYSIQGAQSARRSGEFPLPLITATNGRLYVAADLIVDLYQRDLVASGLPEDVSPTPVLAPVIRRQRGRPPKLDQQLVGGGK